MPRAGRLHIPGGLYHVMGRGLERRWVFKADEDKTWFLERFGFCLERAGAQCLAWALMSNHYHFLIRVSDQPLSKVMASLLGSYASYYNKKHRRVGYVFQNRFKSVLCDEDEYLLQLVRYIHLNPDVAKVVENVAALGQYPWTGHAAMLRGSGHSWHETLEILMFFGAGVEQARRRYLEFMQADNLCAPEDLSGGGLIRSYGGWEEVKALRKHHIQCIGDERILGNIEFVESALREDKIGVDEIAQRKRIGWNLESLILAVCERLDVSPMDLHKKGRANNISVAKGVVCYLAAKELGLSVTVIARRLTISSPAVSQWIAKGESHKHNLRLGLCTKRVKLINY